MVDIRKSDITIRDAVVDDLPYIRSVYEKSGTIEYDNSFFERLGKALRTGVYDAQTTSQGDRFVMKVATVRDKSSGARRMAGVVALTTMKLKNPGKTPQQIAAANAAAVASRTAVVERGAGATVRDLPPSHEILETITDASRAAYVLMLAVLPRYRRYEIGHDLLTEAITEVVSIASALHNENADMQAVFMHVPAQDEIAEAFLLNEDFSKLGYIPDFWPEAAAASSSSSAAEEDKGVTGAIVWAKAFHNGELITFAKKKGEALANLSASDLSRTKSRCPRWAMTLLCQFGLPIGIVALLFAISYILVLLGPLRGISSKYMKMGGVDGPSYDVDDYVEEDDQGTDL